MVVKQIFSALFAGGLFGFGLCFSSMVDPKVVVGFLDLSGRWDPRLLLVMMGALLVTMVSFPLILKKSARPLFDKNFNIPTKGRIDLPLILGSMTFGAGWGLSGICPGPAVTALSFGIQEAWVFFAAMLAGMLAFRR